MRLKRLKNGPIKIQRWQMENTMDQWEGAIILLFRPNTRGLFSRIKWIDSQIRDDSYFYQRHEQSSNKRWLLSFLKIRNIHSPVNTTLNEWNCTKMNISKVQVYVSVCKWVDSNKQVNDIIKISKKKVRKFEKILNWELNQFLRVFSSLFDSRLKVSENGFQTVAVRRPIRFQNRNFMEFKLYFGLIMDLMNSMIVPILS